ncbi:MAG TPA: DUF1572 family protein, partial [Rhodothermales bacterium]|nr:DUF1572 family protein [Rhodothermales bacterium]
DAEAALAQVDEGAFAIPLGPGENSLLHLVQHVGGNLRSRFTDFLTSDGEKPDRNRDAEFEDGRTRGEAMALWGEGWAALETTLDALTDDDLGRTITIRGEPHGVLDALLRAFAHQSYHAGQIVLLAKHYAGPNWRTLTVPRGGSAAFNAEMSARFTDGADR